MTSEQRLAANVLGFKDEHDIEAISIVDKAGGLIMTAVDTDKTNHLSRYGCARGACIDPKASRIYISTFGYPDEIIANEIRKNENGVDINHVENLDGNPTSTSMRTLTDDFKIFRCYEGPLIRASKIDGKARLSGHRKIDIEVSKSRWNGVRFRDAYYQCGGIDPSKFFHEDVHTSHWTHFFMVCCADYVTNTRQEFLPMTRGEDIISGYIVYLGSKYNDWGKTGEGSNINDTKDCVLQHIQDIDIETKVDKVYGIIHPKELTVDGANEFLLSGYHGCPPNSTDMRAMPGEAVMLQRTDDSGNRINIRVMSPGYAWREMIRSSNPSIYHQFIMSTGDARYPKDITRDEYWNRYYNKYIKFPLFNKEQLEEYMVDGHIISLPHSGLNDKEKEEMNSRFNVRMKHIWINYVFSLPLHAQKNALDYYDRLNANKKKLSNFIIKIKDGKVQAGEGKPLKEFHPRIRDVISMAMRDHINHRSSIMSAIKSYIIVEHSNVLHQMIQQCSRYDEW